MNGYDGGLDRFPPYRLATPGDADAYIIEPPETEDDDFDYYEAWWESINEIGTVNGSGTYRRFVDRTKAEEYLADIKSRAPHGAITRVIGRRLGDTRLSYE